MSSRARMFLVLLSIAACADPEADDGGGESLARSQAALVSTCRTSTPIETWKELTIVDPSVVNGPEASNATGPDGGALSFRRTMTVLAGGQDVAAFTERFLRTWNVSHQVGRAVLPARRADLLLDPAFGHWPRVNGQLDMARAPFRLLAVVNRVDLMDDAGKPNGEARLVYGLVDQRGASSTGAKMSIIFEFDVPARFTRRAWAERWHALASVPFGADFNRKLADGIVAELVAPENLSQLRTNERFFATPWELRELQLVDGALVPVTTKQSPDPALVESPELVAWVKANQDDILGHTHVVPDRFLSGRSLANTSSFNAPGTSLNSFFGTRWLTSAAANGIPESVRFAFAQETCNGCHSSDAGQGGALGGFYQISPEVEPDATGTNRVSGSLKQVELPRRAKVMSSLLSCACMASYEVVARRAGGTTSRVHVTNLGATPLPGWRVFWDYASGERIASVSGGRRVPETLAPKNLVENLAGAAAIPAGGRATFELTTVTSGLSPTPGALSVHCQ